MLCLRFKIEIKRFCTPFTTVLHETCMYVFIRFIQNPPFFLNVCCECRGAPSQHSITSFKTTEGFCSSFVPLMHASACAPPLLLENLILRICSHVQQTAGELSQRSQMSEVALRAWIRVVQMWAEPSHRCPESLLNIGTV